MFTKSNTKFLNTDLFAQRKHLVPPGLSHTSGYEILDNLHHLVDLGVFICKSSLAESLRVSSKRYTPSFLGKENDSFAGNRPGSSRQFAGHSHSQAWVGPELLGWVPDYSVQSLRSHAAAELQLRNVA
ncbi:unnamed protein product [Pipistrellus nathusii]|uniref:Uncharacterized protein n=1 Tax=Pipistrellus nathusii TaxID=59473 RepID=A0ABP0AC18_PIPNA